MLSYIKSACVNGISGNQIDVETDISNGIPLFELVGLSGKVANESKERVRSAIRNSDFLYPMKRILINMSPAEIRKEGSQFDLAIALGILNASNQITPENDLISKFIFIGELSLNGRLKPINGVLPILLNAVDIGIKGVVLPEENVEEGAVVREIDILGAGDLKEVVNFVENSSMYNFSNSKKKRYFSVSSKEKHDFKDVIGQRTAKRALEIAAAGNHNCIMTGAPGSGKSMLARRITGILPDMTEKEYLETGVIYSITGLLNKDRRLSEVRPFRDPHHSITTAALIGGGTYPRPGEISLAHNGVLFLDEVNEFNPSAIEMLREPMTTGKINIARNNINITYPGNFMLIAAANPCKCGMLYDNVCTCTPYEINKYKNKLSGAIQERIDIKVEIHSSDIKCFYGNGNENEESSGEIKLRVDNARKIQLKRYRDDSIYSNSQMDTKIINKYVRINSKIEKIIQQYSNKVNLSVRGYISIFKIAMTIADLEEKSINEEHILEAIQYKTEEHKRNGGNYG